MILEHLGAQKGKKGIELIEAKGCRLLFLPGFEPDFSPIEEAKSCAQTCTASGRGSNP